MRKTPGYQIFQNFKLRFLRIKSRRNLLCDINNQLLRLYIQLCSDSLQVTTRVFKVIRARTKVICFYVFVCQTVQMCASFVAVFTRNYSLSTVTFSLLSTVNYRMPLIQLNDFTLTTLQSIQFIRSKAITVLNPFSNVFGNRIIPRINL